MDLGELAVRDETRKRNSVHTLRLDLPWEANPPRAEPVYAALLATLTAHGTNLGIATMANSTEG
jgi:hypothetical protein